MERVYTDGVKDDVRFFIGDEVEKTPAYRQTTLFVVGVQDIGEILKYAKEGCATHIYLGANKSFNQDEQWRVLVDELLHRGFWVTLDYPLRVHNFVMRLLNQEMRHSKFIPMISVEIPNIEGYSYNTMIKIDDVSLDYSNPGVWCHSLHNLMSRETFTPWDLYKNDEVIK